MGEFINNFLCNQPLPTSVKKGRSTSTLSVTLQSITARALYEGKYGLVSSLDLSSAFDVVNKDLLLKRLRIVGLSDDLVDLVSIWLRKGLNM
jgi:hypothetical protein